MRGTGEKARVGVRIMAAEAAAEGSFSKRRQQGILQEGGGTDARSGAASHAAQRLQGAVGFRPARHESMYATVIATAGGIEQMYGRMSRHWIQQQRNQDTSSELSTSV